MNTQKLLPSPPGDEFGDQQLVAPSAPEAPFVTDENGLETVTVTAAREIDWGKVWFAVAVVGAVWYLTRES
jgi:hypothetical protein